MKFYPFHKPVMYIKVGEEFYDSQLYMQAVREADHDPGLKREIEQLEEKYILKHLKLLAYHHPEEE